MIKEIITDPDKLFDRCDEVDVRKQGNEIRQIVLDLKETIRATPNCTGLAANQIGYDKRIFVINFNNDLRSFINPIITNVKGLTIAKEGCVSIPGKTFIRPRHPEIDVVYQTPLGQTEQRKFFGLAANVFQHELDHLDGLLISDVGLEIGEDFEQASEEDKAAVIKMYMESLDLKQKDVDKEIEETPELKEMSDAVKFLKGVQTGEVKLGESVTVTKQEWEEKQKEIEKLNGKQTTHADPQGDQ